MELLLIGRDAVLALHDAVLNPNEIAGLAGDKSLDAVVGRVGNRLQYGLIEDVFDLAATYAVVLAVGHVFNDGNKRTAFTVMDICLVQNGIEPGYDVIEAADMIIRAAQGIVDEKELALWLRRRVG
ncbi:MAG TPA: type II toxin-antitoxin system death-on-curing family toxin [Pseudomonadales bacterium]|nr:type II toxin-antitoxin system death-on-curing family toxin [Pseudomonadales bacterium]